MLIRLTQEARASDFKKKPYPNAIRCTVSYHKHWQARPTTMTRDEWCIEIPDLQALLSFIDEHGDFVLRKDADTYPDVPYMFEEEWMPPYD